MRLKLKIGGRLMLAGAVTIIVPFAIMGVIVSMRADSGIRDVIKGQLIALTSSIADYAENKIQGDVRASMALAASGDVIEGVEAANRGGAAAARTISSLSARLAALGDSGQYKDSYSGIVVAGANGIVVSSSKAAFIGIDVSDRDYFKAALEGRPFVSQLLYNKVTSEASVAISAPVVGAGSGAIGVAAIFMRTTAITDEMAKFVLGRTGYIWVIDREGLVVLHPDKEMALKTNIAQLAGMERVAKNALADAKGMESYVYKGARKVGAYAPIPSIGWKAIATIPESEFLATAIDIRNVIVLVAIAAVMLAFAALYILSRSISVPLRHAADHAMVMAEGDLVRETAAAFLARGDEIGTLAAAFKKQRDNLVAVIADIRTASTNVAQGSEEMSTTAQAMSQGATEQAASAEEISSSVEEMAATIRQNSDNAQATRAIAAKAVNDAEEGNKAVSASVAAMGQIAEKINIIEEIARQTNLLALNAAIEAARAGESGRGFAVVASEVRKLAERSQRAAGEITGLSRSTVELSQSAGRIIAAIVPDIRRTAELVQEIASASAEQSVGVEQIGKAMIQLDTVIQQNASGSEEMAAMSEELSSQSQQLAATISFFRLPEESAPARRPAKAIAPSGNPR
jgi:methyl-accepting chemotaxis protein